MTITIRGNKVTSLRDDILAAAGRSPSSGERFLETQSAAGSGGIVTTQITAADFDTPFRDNVYRFSGGIDGGGEIQGFILNGFTDWNAVPGADGINLTGLALFGNLTGTRITSLVGNGNVAPVLPFEPFAFTTSVLAPPGSAFDLYQVRTIGGPNRWSGFSFDKGAFYSAIAQYALGITGALDAILDNEVYDFNGSGKVIGGNFADLLRSNGGFVEIHGGGGDDLITGGSRADLLFGDAGNDKLDGGGGADSLTGGDGNDIYVIDQLGDQIIDTSGIDRVQSTISLSGLTGIEILILLGTSNINATGRAGLADTIVGNSGDNALDGGTGSDVIRGAFGNDLLTGGGGSDAFVFNTTLNGLRNVDTITDFDAPTDRIQLDDARFIAIGPRGRLASAAFAFGASATEADDRILYDPVTGILRYDADGNGTAFAEVAFAILAGAPAISAGDFFVI